MKQFGIKVVVNAVAIWVATLVVPGLGVGGAGTDEWWQTALTFLVIGPTLKTAQITEDAGFRAWLKLG